MSAALDRAARTARARTGPALRVSAKADDLDRLVLPVEERPVDPLPEGACRVEVASAGVNPPT